MGPHLVGAYGRKAGTVGGFAYSSGLADADLVWDEGTLNPWLEDPKAFIPSTKMVLKLSKPQDRADVIGNLKSLSDQ